MKPLTPKAYRRFGLELGVIVAVFFGLLIPYLWEGNFPVWPWLVLVVLLAVSLVSPKALAPLHKAWMTLGLWVGKITTPIVLVFIFFMVVCPTGLIMRMFRPDPLNRRLSKSVSSYRIQSEENPREHLEFPF